MERSFQDSLRVEWKERLQNKRANLGYARPIEHSVLTLYATSEQSCTADEDSFTVRWSALKRDLNADVGVQRDVSGRYLAREGVL